MCDQRSSQLTVAMATNPNVNTGSHSEQSSEYNTIYHFLVLPLLLSAPFPKANGTVQFALRIGLRRRPR